MTNSYEPPKNIFTQGFPELFGLEFLKKLIMTIENITITKTEYRDLLETAEILRRLDNGGVDNWDFFGDSLKREEGDEFISRGEAEDILVDKDIFCGTKTKTLHPYDGNDEEIILARNYLLEFYDYKEVEA